MSTIALIELIATILGASNNLINILKAVQSEKRDNLTDAEVAQVKGHIADYFNGPNFQN